MSERKSLEKALDFLPMDKIIQKGDKVIITPNWVKDQSPKDGVVVGPKTLQKLIKYIKIKKNRKRGTNIWNLKNINILKN